MLNILSLGKLQHKSNKRYSTVFSQYNPSQISHPKQQPSTPQKRASRGASNPIWISDTDEVLKISCTKTPRRIFGILLQKLREKDMFSVIDIYIYIICIVERRERQREVLNKDT